MGPLHFLLDTDPTDISWKYNPCQTLAIHIFFFFLAAAEDNKEVPGLRIGLVMVGLRTRIGIDIEQYSVFLGEVGKENMTWILTLGLSGWAPRRKGKPSM